MSNTKPAKLIWQNNDMFCSKHPTYNGKRKPRGRCRVCWTIYKLVNPAVRGDNPEDWVSVIYGMGKITKGKAPVRATTPTPKATLGGRRAKLR